MRRQLLQASIIAALVVSGCATLRVSSHTDRGLVWSNYETFDWGPADALPPGDPRLDKDPFFEDRVEGAIEKAMAGHGFSRSAPSERPDVLIHYHANITERVDVSEIDGRHGSCAAVDCGSVVTRYEAGTVVVDMVDAASNVLIWRGWAQGSVDGVLGNRDRLRRRIDESVRQMFEAFPHSR